MTSFKRKAAEALVVYKLRARRYRKVLTTSVIVAVLAVYLFAFSAPPTFAPSIIVIPRGASAPEVSQILVQAHLIRHSVAVRFLLRITGTSDVVHAGAYRFTSPESAFTITYRLVFGDYGIPVARTTFPEGTTVREMAEQLASTTPLISEESFLAAARPYEGYLFPDTYIFPPDADAESVVKTMRANFNTKVVTPLTKDINASGHSLSDIVIMASLIEKEARSLENKQIIAGILYNRLAAHMPLQVDAVFGYIKNRDTYSPSFTDLTVDSLYNTYKHKGLPPGPIDNPGLDSILAVLHPTKSNYLYYLTGRDGLMHYATTYAGHQANLNTYLH